MLQSPPLAVNIRPRQTDGLLLLLLFLLPKCHPRSSRPSFVLQNVSHFVLFLLLLLWLVFYCRHPRLLLLLLLIVRVIFLRISPTCNGGGQGQGKARGRCDSPSVWTGISNTCVRWKRNVMTRKMKRQRSFS